MLHIFIKVIVAVQIFFYCNLAAAPAIVKKHLPGYPEISISILKDLEKKKFKTVKLRSNRDLAVRMQWPGYVRECLGGGEAFISVVVNSAKKDLMQFSYIAISVENLLYIYNIKEKKERVVVLNAQQKFERAIEGYLKTGVGVTGEFPVLQKYFYFKPMIFKKGDFWEAAPKKVQLSFLKENEPVIFREIEIKYPASTTDLPCVIPIAYVDVDI